MFGERSKAYGGSITYPIHRLRHESASDNPRQLDLKNVGRLVKVFELEGCHRLKVENHIPALISRTSFSGLTQSIPGGERRLKALDEEPVIADYPDNLTYLYGRHRLEAAKSVLPASQKWWVVDLYVDEQLSEGEIQELRDEHLNARNFFDGDIFRHLRQCHLIGDLHRKKKWLSRLSEAKRRDVQTLEKRKDTESRLFAQSLDALIPFIGLWPALRIGTFHRLLSLRCLEELTRYVTSIHKTWNNITGGDESICSHIDSVTVTILQGRCPHDSEDRKRIETQRSKVFPTVPDPATRGEIWGRIMSVRSIIPSLHTFLEDTKYLEPCAKILKQLLPVKCKGTINQAFERLHNGQRELKLQMAEDESYIQYQDAASHLKAYRQLWLFAMRHFPQMIGHQPRKDGKAKTTTTKTKAFSPEYIWWHGIAELATACGYNDVTQPFANAVDADVMMAEDFVRRVRPISCTDTAFDFDHKVQTIVAVLKDERKSPASTRSAAASRPCPGDIAHRCGVPFQDTFEADNPFLFLSNIYDESETRGPLSTFAVKRDMFLKFFGPLDEDHYGVDHESPTNKGISPMSFSISEYDRSPSPLTPVHLPDKRPPIEYSASEYSQLSGSVTPVASTNKQLEKQPQAEYPTSRNERPLPDLPMQAILYAEAMETFWRLQDNPNPDDICILKEETPDAFTVDTLAHSDLESIVRNLGNSRLYVGEGPDSRRQRLTYLHNIRDRREPCVMVYHVLREGLLQKDSLHKT